MQVCPTGDGSFSAYSKEYDEHYHSTKDGALTESLHKHIIPAFDLVQKDELTILDICYGLGFNTLTTLFYAPKKKLTIHSPELDQNLIQELAHFPYPKEFDGFKEIIHSLSTKYYYESKNINIYIHLGDARSYLKNATECFDIIYQDAFSPKKNPALWTVEYFKELARLSHENTIITTYSQATPVRLAMHENGFKVHTYEKAQVRSGTIASKQVLKNLELVDMELKLLRNPNAVALRDTL